jgi:hypothetical protein
MNGSTNGVEKNNGVYSPNGWKLEPLSRFVEDHTWAVNRSRNIIAALENLLVQLGSGWCQSEFILKVKAAKEVYESEMDWHMHQLKFAIDSHREKE